MTDVVEQWFRCEVGHLVVLSRDPVVLESEIATGTVPSTCPKPLADGVCGQPIRPDR